MSNQRTGNEFGPIDGATTQVEIGDPEIVSAGDVWQTIRGRLAGVHVRHGAPDDRPEMVEPAYASIRTFGGALTVGLALRFPDGTACDFWISAKRSEDGKEATVRYWAEGVTKHVDHAYGNPNPDWFVSEAPREA